VIRAFLKIIEKDEDAPEYCPPHQPFLPFSSPCPYGLESKRAGRLKLNFSGQDRLDLPDHGLPHLFHQHPQIPIGQPFNADRGVDFHLHPGRKDIQGITGQNVSGAVQGHRQDGQGYEKWQHNSARPATRNGLLNTENGCFSMKNGCRNWVEKLSAIRFVLTENPNNLKLTNGHRMSSMPEILKQHSLL